MQTRGTIVGAVVASLAASAPTRADSPAPQAPDRNSSVVISSTRVKDPALGDPSLLKLTEPLIDTPQSISTLSSEEWSARGNTNLDDALRNVPGITLGAGETSWQGNNFYLRGFTTRDDMFQDGQRDYGYYYRDPFDMERVEVLKGPSSILFGRGSAGGVINEVSKVPTLESRSSAAVALDSADMRRATLDINTPADLLGDAGAVRLNTMAQESQYPDRDVARTRRWGVAPSLALGLGTSTRLFVSYLHQLSNDVPDYGIPWLNGKPAPVDRSNFYGFASDHLDTRVDVATARIEHSFNDRVLLSSQARYSHDTRDFRITEAAVPAGVAPGTPLAAINFTRNEFQGFSTDTFLQDQTDLTLSFTTGSLRHAAVTGFEVGRESPRPTYVTNVGVPGGNLADPVQQPYSVSLSYPRLSAATVVRTEAFYALDTIDLGARWQVMGGIRWDRFDAVYRSTGYDPAGQVTANTALDHRDTGLSYRGALVYVLDRGSLYASWGTSFDPSAEGIESLISSGRAVAQANLNLDPEKNRSYEIGSKWSFAGGRLRLTQSLFRIEKYNARVPDPTVPGFNTLGGDQRVDGLELELVGQLSQRWRLRAGYTYLDSEVVRTAPGGPVLGAPLTVTPRNSSALWVEYRILPPLEIGIGALQASSRLGQDTAAQYEVAPGYIVMSSMVKYAVSTHASVQLNLDNLTDTRYYDQLHPFHVVPGAGFGAQLSLTIRH
ncbi:MAG TPA: TonB-dependent receptor [Steroidobacteraceae bacterium]|jgi:catecholate siderophore receptor